MKLNVKLSFLITFGKVVHDMRMKLMGDSKKECQKQMQERDAYWNEKVS